jgi:hypothetical protein
VDESRTAVSTVSYVWYWTFWHWTIESFRSGALLRGPLQGIGSHWDEWFRHEASPDDRRSIEHAGRSELSQRRFVTWLVRRWATEAAAGRGRPPIRFVLGQLAQVPPFAGWRALDAYRTSYGVRGIAAVVLAEGSRGESTDVRAVEALLLPADADATSRALVSEGFHADRAELADVRQATLSLLNGRGFLRLLLLWTVAGRRPYPRWLSGVLRLGWVAVAGLLVALLVGPDPRERLVPLSLTLAGLWVALALVAIVAAATLWVRAWRVGRDASAQLARSEVRLRMNGGMTLQGSSAGLPFALDTLLAVFRDGPPSLHRSWLWRRFARRLRAGAGAWAATGVVAAEGWVRAVILEPKVRACLRHPGVARLLMPRQHDATQRSIDRLATSLSSPAREQVARPPGAGVVAIGYASASPPLRGYWCRHIADAVMAVGDLRSRSQSAMTLFSLAVSLAMVAAMPDLRHIILPPPAPVVVAPSSPTPYELWVSLDTPDPEQFSVVFESGFWANRRSEVAAYRGNTPSVRAEIRLSRLTHQTTHDAEDGTVWVERRQRLFGREFAAGQRVGRYSFSYLARLGRE